MINIIKLDYDNNVLIQQPSTEVMVLDHLKKFKINSDSTISYIQSFTKNKGKAIALISVVNKNYEYFIPVTDYNRGWHEGRRINDNPLNSEGIMVENRVGLIKYIQNNPGMVGLIEALNEYNKDQNVIKDNIQAVYLIII